jgi:hypothetical protein
LGEENPVANNVPSAHGSGRGLGREGNVSIFKESRANKGSMRRVRVRHLLPFALLALVSALLVPAGGAKPPPVTSFEICVQNATTGTPAPPCTSTGAASAFTGNLDSEIQLTITNDRDSTVSLGSADVAVPAQLKVIPDSGFPAANVGTSAGQTVQIRNISLNKGQSFVATFHVGTACGGTADWSVGQKAFNSTDGTGSPPFGLVPQKSTGLQSTISTECHLAFVQQPTDTTSGDTIVNRLPQDDQSVTVGLFKTNGDPLGACPVGYESGCSVDVASVAGGVTGTTTRPLVGGNLASFDDLSITNSALATQYNLIATGDGGFAPETTSGPPAATSSSFLIAQTVTGLLCPGSSCTTGNKPQPLSGTGLGPSFVDVTSSSGFNFMTVSPFTLSTRPTPPAGCTGIKSFLVTGFAESDNRQPGSGTLTIRYYVNKDLLVATYGKNVGNQFIPMCVGARPVDESTGTIHDCNDPNYQSTGWLGDPITSGGKFAPGQPVPAQCDADGYYYGIISSFQDKLDATKYPTVTNWGGTQIGGDNYRFFDMTIPPGWDWRSGP